jgi:hypothetical protein
MESNDKKYLVTLLNNTLEDITTNDFSTSEVAKTLITCLTPLASETYNALEPGKPSRFMTPTGEYFQNLQIPRTSAPPVTDSKKCCPCSEDNHCGCKREQDGGASVADEKGCCSCDHLDDDSYSEEELYIRYGNPSGFDKGSSESDVTTCDSDEYYDNLHLLFSKFFQHEGINIVEALLMLKDDISSDS